MSSLISGGLSQSRARQIRHYFSTEQQQNQKTQKNIYNNRFIDWTYRRLWGGKSRFNSIGNTSVHSGFWYSETRSLEEAIQNENIFVASLLGMKDGDRLLDAGCGLGNTTISIAKLANESGIRVNLTGITLSAHQARMATKYAKANDVSGSVDFSVMNYLLTGFREDTFDGIFAVEAVCSTPSKKHFLAEAYDNLKKGGKLVIADPVLTRADLGPADHEQYQLFCQGFGQANWVQKDEFLKLIEAAGFRNAVMVDVTAQVRKSEKKMVFWGKVLTPVAKVLRALNFISTQTYDHCLGLLALDKIMDKFCSYCVYVAEK